MATSSASVDAFALYLADQGWAVSVEVEFCDLVAERDGERLYVEAKGRTEVIGTDVDTMYGQMLRRMPVARIRRLGSSSSCLREPRVRLFGFQPASGLG